LFDFYFPINQILSINGIIRKGVILFMPVKKKAAAKKPAAKKTVKKAAPKKAAAKKKK
jgi:hypothetical protein